MQKIPIRIKFLILHIAKNHFTLTSKKMLKSPQGEILYNLARFSGPQINLVTSPLLPQIQYDFFARYLDHNLNCRAFLKIYSVKNKKPDSIKPFFVCLKQLLRKKS